MKRYGLFLAFLLAFLLFPVQALAVEFTIENTEINAYLQENGNVQVTEEHTYRFDGEFNGITRTLIPQDYTSITNFKAAEGGVVLPFEKDENLYKVYRSGNDETIIIDLSYTITNGVTVYSDLGQFYWPFFDESNEAVYENLDIYIHPPEPADGALALGYGEAAGTAETGPDGIVRFSLGKVSDGENGDIRAAYDEALFSATPLVTDESIREDIMADKLALEEKAAAFENRQQFFGLLAPIITGILLVTLSTLLLIAWRKKQATIFELERNPFRQTFMPAEEMSLPAIIYYMNKATKRGEIIAASLLNLVRKGLAANKDEEEFIAIRQNIPLLKHEKILLNWLFYKIGDKGVFSLSDLQAYTDLEANRETYSNDFHHWLDAVREEVIESGLFDKQTKLRWTAAAIGLLGVPFSIMFGIFELWFWLAAGFLLSTALVIYALAYRPLTVKGLRIKRQWEEFSSHYDTVTEKQWNEWMSDEQLRALIYGVGTNNQEMISKNRSFLEKFSSPSYIPELSGVNMMMTFFIAGTLTTAFDTASDTVSASTVSAAGGTGAGIDGGGGGSGAF